MQCTRRWRELAYKATTPSLLAVRTCHASLRCSAGVVAKPKSTGEGGGAGVSSMVVERLEIEEGAEALKAADTSWPRVLLV